ncbi:MAG: type toxin-antitoxin system death-on-curing family toxin [Francisellaceae bacterium]|nr:type toxin-antitoxin system death-on-curing family toxin [Francisellaceae bacterium]
MRVITADQIINFNKRICSEYGNQHVILNKSLVESAVGTAFFDMKGVGYVHGEISEIAAALCFKIIKNHAFGDGNKRTAAISSIIFLNLNGWKLSYLQDDSGTELHRVIESVADNKTTEKDLKKWFVKHAYQLNGQ